LEDLVVGHNLAAVAEVHTDTSSHFTMAFTDIGFVEGIPYKLVVISTMEDTTGTVEGSLEQEASVTSTASAAIAASATSSILNAIPCFSTLLMFTSPEGQLF
jgi:Fe2+ transport system protein B